MKLATAGRRAGGKEEGLADKAKSCAGRVGAIVREVPWSSVGKTCRPLLFEWHGSYHSYILSWIMSLLQAKAMEDLFHSTHKKCFCYCRVAGIAEEISLSFWEMWERDHGLGPSAVGPLPSGKRSRTGLCTNSTRKAGVRASGTLQGVSIDMGMGVLRVRTCSNSQLTFGLENLY